MVGGPGLWSGSKQQRKFYLEESGESRGCCLHVGMANLSFGLRCWDCRASKNPHSEFEGRLKTRPLCHLLLLCGVVWDTDAWVPKNLLPLCPYSHGLATQTRKVKSNSSSGTSSGRSQAKYVSISPSPAGPTSSNDSSSNRGHLVWENQRMCDASQKPVLLCSELTQPLTR